MKVDAQVYHLLVNDSSDLFVEHHLFGDEPDGLSDEGVAQDSEDVRSTGRVFDKHRLN